ncbi:MAG: GNAT family N-acetyltransferase [Ideonella sp.]|nr:GNAT family N-acetyltransferase [Ideonella sp.]
MTPALRIEPLSPQTRDGAKALIRRVWTEHFGQHPDPLVRDYMDDERVLSGLSPETYSPPKGLFLVVRDGDAVVGCGGVLQMADGRHAFHRLYVAASHRRLSLAQRIMAACTEFARQHGGHTLCLSSNKALTVSHRFYRNLGFEPTDAWDEHIAPYAYFFQRAL